MNTFCPDHKNVEMKLVPSGISKRTGRPYDAFYACPIKDCKNTAPAKDQPSYEEKQDTLKAEAGDEREYWETRKDRERRISARQTSLNAAATIVAAQYTAKYAVDEWKILAKAFYEWIIGEDET